MTSLSDLRVDYDGEPFTDDGLTDDPLVLFCEWLEAARAADVFEPDAMTLATVSPDGSPAARMVLLKEVCDKGFVFFTNYGSDKAGDLEHDPRVALVFHWDHLYRQVRVVGRASRLARDESEAYFRTRPRASQLGAWASPQSRVLPDRADLHGRFDAVKQRFAEDEVLPCPANWGGYVITPQRVEFWQGQRSRMHDRLRYELTTCGWQVVRLAP